MRLWMGFRGPVDGSCGETYNRRGLAGCLLIFEGGELLYGINQRLDGSRVP
jgi:hypothetical protein